MYQKPRTHFFIYAVLSACGAPVVTPAQAPSVATTPAAKPSPLTINRSAPKEAELQRLENATGSKPSSGDYWYDSRSGLAGRLGSHAEWSVGPGYDFGPLPADASAGNTGIYYNERELPYAEALFVCWLYDIDPTNITLFRGHYLLEATGDIYTTDETQVPLRWLGNLLWLAQQKGAQQAATSAADGPWSSNGAAGNSQGGCSYISIPNSSGIGVSSTSSGC